MKRPSWGWLGLLLAIAIPRLLFSACTHDFGADGGYYTDIADNLQHGRGLTTDLSVFHQGFPSLPYPTPVYPLWPLVYGAARWVVRAPEVGIWLPTLLYAASVALAFPLGRRLAPRLDLGPRWPALHGGHVFSLVVALLVEFASATARPYTEGLAFVLLFLTFLRARPLFARLGVVAGLELGLWLSALFFTRSQFVVVAIAAVGGAAVATLRRPGRALPFVAGAVAVGGGLWAAYLSWLRQYFPSPSLTTYIRFDLARVPSALSEVPVMVSTRGPLDKLLDIVESFRWAFSFKDATSSYYHLHHSWIYALPLALGLVVSQWRRLPALWRFLRSTSGPYMAFYTLAALGLMGSLHTVHKTYGSEWVFGGRHAIPTMFIFGSSLLVLLRSRQRWAFLSGVFLFLSGAWSGWQGLAVVTQDRCRAAAKEPALLDYRKQLQTFLQEEHLRLSAFGPLVVAVERPEAQRLAWRTQGVGFHWMTETTTTEDLTVMVRDLKVRYVVDFADISYLTLSKREDFMERFVLAAVFDEQGESEDDSDSDATPSKSKRRTYVYAPNCHYFEVPTCLNVPPPELQPLVSPPSSGG